MQLKMYTDADKERAQPIGESARLTPESYRSDYRRDTARLLHAPSFRRLQGKTQLFPGQESDFFRNRLTHSLEVSQIAESIGYKLNHDIKNLGEEYAECQIDIDILRFASLAHDLGHPPFGHLGEEVLNCKMAQSGGFEGNAQTLHILTKLEKGINKDDRAEGIENDCDYRLGLNLTYRSLASILKYDECIDIDPAKRVNAAAKTMHPQKGYYSCEKDIVRLIKEHVAPGFDASAGKFKSVECAIMDVADDIAYSTYDLEDALKAGFITPMAIIATPGILWDSIVVKVNESLAKEHASLGNQGEVPVIDREKALTFIKELFGPYLIGDDTEGEGEPVPMDKFKLLQDAYATSNLLANDSKSRTELTSYLVGRFIRSVQIDIDEDFPALSKVYLDVEARKFVEILKQFTWQYQILNHRLKIVASRGVEIVDAIFDLLSSEKGHELLPNDFHYTYDQFKDEALKKRVICDFVAGMTDRYAIEFYGRLKSMSPETIFKPL